LCVFEQNSKGALWEWPTESGVHALIEVDLEFDQQLERVHEYRVVFVVDTSGSMSTSINSVKQSLQYFLDQWSKTMDRDPQMTREIAILAFDDNVKTVYPMGKFSTNIHYQIVGHIAALKAGGSTDLGKALNEALSLIMKEQARHLMPTYLIFLTDGQPRVGLQSAKEIRDLKESFKIPWLYTFSLGFEKDYDSEILFNIGEFIHIDNVVQMGECIGTLYFAMERAIATDASVRFQQGTSPFNPPWDSVFTSADAPENKIHVGILRPRLKRKVLFFVRNYTERFVGKEGEMHSLSVEMFYSIIRQGRLENERLTNQILLLKKNPEAEGPKFLRILGESFAGDIRKYVRYYVELTVDMKDRLEIIAQMLWSFWSSLKDPQAQKNSQVLGNCLKSLKEPGSSPSKLIHSFFLTSDLVTKDIRELPELQTVSNQFARAATQGYDVSHARGYGDIPNDTDFILHPGRYSDSDSSPTGYGDIDDDSDSTQGMEWLERQLFYSPNPALDRAKSEDILAQQPPRTFLVRKKSADRLVVSWKPDEGLIKHFLIAYNDQSRVFWVETDPSTKYHSFKDIINVYQLVPIALNVKSIGSVTGYGTF
jgi:uncharacterized protein YegL